MEAVDYDDLLPPEIADSDSFIGNAKQFCQLDVDTLRKLRQNLPANPSDLRDVASRRSLAEKVGLDEKSYGVLSAFVRMLMAAADNANATPESVVDFIVKKSDCRVADEMRKELVDFFSETQEEKSKEEEVNAFYFGKSYAGAEFRPLIAPVGSAKAPKYFIGGNLTVNSIDQNGDRQHLSIHLGYSELVELLSTLKRGVKVLDALRDSVMKLSVKEEDPRPGSGSGSGSGSDGDVL